MFYWVTVAIIAWHTVLWFAHRAYVRHTRIQFFDVGHKLGRVSGMIGQEQVNKWLDEAGIDHSLLPPR